MHTRGGELSTTERAKCERCEIDISARVRVCPFCFGEMTVDEQRMYSPRDGTAKCETCIAPILWVVMLKNGVASKPAPLDARPVASGNIVVRPGKQSDKLYGRVVAADQFVGEPRYLSHFATCPGASQHRRR